MTNKNNNMNTPTTPFIYKDIPLSEFVNFETCRGLPKRAPSPEIHRKSFDYNGFNTTATHDVKVAYISNINNHVLLDGFSLIQFLRENKDDPDYGIPDNITVTCYNFEATNDKQLVKLAAYSTRIKAKREECSTGLSTSDVIHLIYRLEKCYANEDDCESKVDQMLKLGGRPNKDMYREEKAVVRSFKDVDGHYSHNAIHCIELICDKIKSNPVDWILIRGFCLSTNNDYDERIQEILKLETEKSTDYLIGQIVIQTRQRIPANKRQKTL